MGDRAAAPKSVEMVREQKSEDQSVNASKQQRCTNINTSVQFTMLEGRIRDTTNEDGTTTSALIGFDGERPTIIMSNSPRPDYTSIVTTSVGRNKSLRVSHKFTKFKKTPQETRRSKNDVQSSYPIPKMGSYSNNMVSRRQESNPEIAAVSQANDSQANDSKVKENIQKASSVYNRPRKAKKSYSFIAKKLSSGSKISCHGTNGGKNYGGSRFRAGQTNPTTKVCMPTPPRDKGKHAPESRQQVNSTRFNRSQVKKLVTYLKVEPYLGRKAPTLKKVKVKMNKAQQLRAESVRLKKAGAVKISASYIAWDSSTKSTKKSANSFSIREVSRRPSNKVKMNRAQSIRALAVRKQSATREMERTSSMDQPLCKQRRSKGNIEDVYRLNAEVEQKRSSSVHPKLSGSKQSKANNGIQAVQKRSISACVGTKPSSTQPNKVQPRRSIADQSRKNSMGNYATASQRRNTFSSMGTYASPSRRRKTISSMATYASPRRQSRAKSIQNASNLNIRKPSKTPKQLGGRSQTPIELAHSEDSISPVEYDMKSTESSNKYSDQSWEESSVASFDGSDSWETYDSTASLDSDCTLMRADLHGLKKEKVTLSSNGKMSSMAKVFNYLNILEPSFFKDVDSVIEPDDKQSGKSRVAKPMHNMLEIGSKFESISATELTSVSQHTAFSFLDAEKLQPVANNDAYNVSPNPPLQKSTLVNSSQLRTPFVVKSVSFAPEVKLNSPEDSDTEIELFDGPGTKHLEILRKEFGGDAVNPQIQIESSLISLPNGILAGSLPNSIKPPAQLPKSVPGSSVCDSTRRQKRRNTYCKSHERDDTKAQKDKEFKYPVPGQRLSCSNESMQGVNNYLTPPASEFGSSTWLPEIPPRLRAESRNSHGNSFPHSTRDQRRPRPYWCSSNRSKSPCRDDSRTGVHSCNAGKMVPAGRMPPDSHYICDVKNALRILSEETKPKAGRIGHKPNSNKTTISPLTLDSAIHVDDDLFHSDQTCLDDDTQVSLVFPEQQDTSWLTEDLDPSTGPRHASNMPIIDHTDSLRHITFDTPYPGPSSRHQAWGPP